MPFQAYYYFIALRHSSISLSQFVHHYICTLYNFFLLCSCNTFYNIHEIVWRVAKTSRGPAPCAVTIYINSVSSAHRSGGGSFMTISILPLPRHPRTAFHSLPSQAAVSRSFTENMMDVFPSTNSPGVAPTFTLVSRSQTTKSTLSFLTGWGRLLDVWQIRIPGLTPSQSSCHSWAGHQENVFGPESP